MGVATSIGAVANVAMNLAFIPYFGAMGAAVATAVSYALMWAFAYRFVRKYVTLGNNLLVDALSYLILIAISVAMIGKAPGRYYICPVLLIVLVLLYYKDVAAIVGRLAGFVKDKFGGKR
jgi:O-antigen/teichoic acid export membrane protein